MKQPWCREGLVVLFLFLQAVVAVTVAYQRPAEISLDVGEPTDLAYVEGFHEPEYSDFYGFSFRWTEEWAEIRLPGVGRARPLRLELDVVGWLDPDGQAMRVTVAQDDEILGQVQVGPIPEGRMEPYRYVLAVPARRSFSGDLVLQLESPTAPVGTDHRQLGLLVDQVRLLYGKGIDIPPLLPALSLLATVLLTYAGVRLAGWGMTPGLLLSSGVTYVLAVLLNLVRLWVVPYLAAVAGMVAITCLLLSLARVIVRWENVR